MAAVSNIISDGSMAVKPTSDETPTPTESKKKDVRPRSSCDPDWHDADDPFRVEHWYPRLKEHTFATATLPLLHKEARCICRFRDLQRVLLLTRDQEERDRNPDGQYGPATWTHDVYSMISTQVMDSLKVEERKILTDLVTRLQDLIDRVTTTTFETPSTVTTTPVHVTEAKVATAADSPAVDPTITAAAAVPTPATSSSGTVGVFVRLSTRSPKDAALTGSRMEAIIRRDIAASKFAGGSLDADIEDVIIFTRALGESLRVNNASEALQLLLNSQRAYDDIARTELIQGGSPETFDMKLIVRKWHQISVEWEFRAFVYDGKLTACTQYYSYCHVPEMVGRRDDIIAHIHAKFALVKDLIDVNNYTIDLAISPTLDLSQTYIVEINHLPPEAGTSLFNWSNIDDKKLIEHGPFTLRILDEPSPSAKKGLHAPLRRLIHSLRGVDDTKYESLSHKDVGCDGCRRFPITCVWYRCHKCRDYDLCQQCFDAKTHYPNDTSHIFRTIESSAEHDDMDQLLDDKLAQNRVTASSSSTKKSSSGSNKKASGTGRACIVS